MSTKKRKPVAAVPRMTTEEIVAACERAVAQHVQKLEIGHGIKLPSAACAGTEGPKLPSFVGEITVQVGETRELLRTLHDRIDSLFNQLAPICSKDPGSTSGAICGSKSALPPVSAIGQEIWEARMQVTGAIERLEYLQSQIAI